MDHLWTEDCSTKKCSSHIDLFFSIVHPTVISFNSQWGRQYWGLASTLSLLSSANVIIFIIVVFIMIIIILIIIAKSGVWTKLPTRQYRFPDQAQSTAHAWTPTVRQSTSSLSSWLLSQCPIIITLAAAIDIVSLSSLSLLSSMLSCCKYDKKFYKYTIEDANKYDCFCRW